MFKYNRNVIVMYNVWRPYPEPQNINDEFLKQN